MALRARGLAAAAVLLLAGCGGADGTPAGTASPGATPDPLYATAKACGIPTSAPFDTPEDLVPFLLEPYVTTVTSPSGAGYRIVLYMDRPLPAVLARIKASAAERGLQVTASEREPFDAEITVREPDGEVYAFRLLILPKCPQAVQLTVIRLQG